MNEAPHYLHVVRDGADAPALQLPAPEAADQETEAIEGEVVPRPDNPGRRLPARIAGHTYPQPSERTVRIARTIAVATVTVGQGWQSWLIRAWDGATLGVHRRQIRAAEAMGDQVMLAEWVERKDREVARRAARLLDLPILAWGLVKLAGFTLAGLVGILLLLSIAVWASGVGEIGSVFRGVGTAIRWILTAASWAWTPLLVATPVVVLIAAYREGCRRGITPTWLIPYVDRDITGDPITPSVVVTALRDLGYAALRKAIQGMDDAGAAMLGPIRIAGCGVEVDVLLPSGSSTDEVQKRRRKLAENLGRHEHEVFITVAPAARTVRLWIADSGALDEPIGPSPLVTDPDMKADYKTGRAPWGQDLRGDAALISLYQRHLLITGQSNQGKTASMRALALWLSFDPQVEFRIGDLKGIGDWAMFKDLATVLIQGPTDEHVMAVTEMVENGVAEMERRLQAPPGTRFDPLILIVDEAQVAFMCPAKGDDGRPYGGTKATSRYFMAARKLHNQGRAADVVLWEGTQDPTDQNLPKLVREGAHIRASLYVGTEAQAKMALGDTAVDGGAAPHKLRQGLDKGTLVTNGGGSELPPGQSSITIRTHYVSTEEADEVADRAKARRKAVITRTSAAVEEGRDLLADLDEVLDEGEERIRLADIPALLRDLAPGRPYQGLTGIGLRDILTREHGVRVINKSNVLWLDPADVRRVRAAREAGE